MRLLFELLRWINGRNVGSEAWAQRVCNASNLLKFKQMVLSITKHISSELEMKPGEYLTGLRRLAAVTIFWLVAGWSATATSADNVRLLLIGDSLSSGYGLSGPGWVELLNQQADKLGLGFEIVNDSISGDTTAGGVARIADGIERVQPDWVIVELGGNDGLRGTNPATIESNLQKMVDIALDSDVNPLLLGIRIPPNYGRTYTSLFEQTFVKVAESTNIPLLPYFIGEVGGDPALNQSDMIHPNEQAQPIIRDRVLAFLREVLGV